MTGRGGGTEVAIVPPSQPGGGGGRCARPPGRARALQGCALAPPPPRRSAHAHPGRPRLRVLSRSRARALGARLRVLSRTAHARLWPSREGRRMRALSRDAHARSALPSVSRARGRVLDGPLGGRCGMGMRHERAQVCPHAPRQTGPRRA